MRKYLISFQFKEIEFSAKVVVKEIQGRSIIATTLINCELDFLLSKASLIFIEGGANYQLILVQKDGNCQMLDWKMGAEFQEQINTIPTSGFSLS